MSPHAWRRPRGRLRAKLGHPCSQTSAARFRVHVDGRNMTTARVAPTAVRPDAAADRGRSSTSDVCLPQRRHRDGTAFASFVFDPVGRDEPFARSVIFRLRGGGGPSKAPRRGFARARRPLICLAGGSGYEAVASSGASSTPPYERPQLMLADLASGSKVIPNGTGGTEGGSAASTSPVLAATSALVDGMARSSFASEARASRGVELVQGGGTARRTAAR